MAEQSSERDPAPTVPDLDLPARAEAKAALPTPGPKRPPPAFPSLEADLDFPFERTSASRPSPDLRRTPGPSTVALSYQRAVSPSVPPGRQSIVADSPRAPDVQAPGTRAPFAVGLVFAAVIAGAAGYAAHRYLPFPTRPLLTLWPRAFDGSSRNASGGVALGALVVAFVFAFVGLRAKPRSWALVAAAFGALLIGLAMVTVTLAAMGGGSASPPDGALAVPYLASATSLALGLAILGRGARIFARPGIGAKIVSIPLAGIAGAMGFVGYEALRALMR